MRAEEARDASRLVGVAARAYRRLRDEHRLALQPERFHHLGRHHHFHLLDNPRVYDQIQRWLVNRPGGDRPPGR